MYFDKTKNRTIRSNVYLVCGAPASGKTTYVNEHKEPGDFVLDLDVLRKALGAPEKISDCFQNQVLMIRELLYRDIEFDRIRGAKNIWVIAGLPDEKQRVMVAKRLRAKIISMETSEDECIRRAMNDTERKDKDKQRQIIYEYFFTKHYGR